MSAEHIVQEAATENSVDRLPSDQSDGEVLSGQKAQISSCIPPLVVVANRSRAEHEQSESKRTSPLAGTSTSFGWTRSASEEGDQALVPYELMDRLSRKQQRRNTTLAGVMGGTCNTEIPAFSYPRTGTNAKAAMCSQLKDSSSFSRIMMRQGEMRERGELKFSRELMPLFSESINGKEADERSGHYFLLHMFAGGLDDGSQMIMMLPQFQGNAMLAKLRQDANRLHENSNVDLHSKATCTTYSIESKEKGVFKLFDSPPGMSSDDKPTRSSPSPENIITVEGRAQDGGGVKVDDRYMLPSFGAYTLKMDTTSSKGLASRKCDKNLALDPAKQSTKDVDASSVKQRSIGRSPGMLLDLNKEQTSFLWKRSSLMDNEEPNAARTDDRGVCDIIPNIIKKKRQENPSGYPTGTVEDSEQSNRLVKRLKMQDADSFALSGKRLGVDNVSSSARVHNLLSSGLDYRGSKSDTKPFSCHEQARSGKKVDGESSESVVKTCSWIRRWCHGRPKASNSPQATKGEACRKANAQSSGMGKLSPSVAAMALMGRAASNFRPCEFRRRGSSVVWNVDEVRHG